MGAKSEISWTDVTWVITEGCDYVSPGCANCYAVSVIHRFAHVANKKISLPLAGLTESRGVTRWTGKVALRHDRLNHPLHWRKPRRVFVTSLGDLFHDSVPDDFLLAVFNTMCQVRHHTYQVLTKHTERMLEFSRRLCWDRRKDELYLAEVGGRPYLPDAPHIWVGTSVENQEWADRRIPVLLQVDCRVRFLCIEPMLGPVSLIDRPTEGAYRWNYLTGERLGTITRDIVPGPGIHFCLVGGESGCKARLCNMDWFRAIRDQCQAAGTALWVKQAGAWVFDRGLQLPYTGRPRAELSELPEDLRIREFPDPEV